MIFNKKYLAGFVTFFCVSAMAVSAPNSSLSEKIDILECDGSKVELVSICQSETVAKSEDHSGLPVCIDQIIKINGQENRREIEKVSQLTSNGSTVKILSNVVVSMACIKGSKGSLISIGGYGGCGACPEWHGYYSVDGKLVNYV